MSEPEAAAALDPQYGVVLDSDPSVREVLSRAREFRRLYIDPHAAALDRALLLDPGVHCPDEILRAACRYGLYTLPIPKFAGGGGKTIIHTALLLEELCAGCAGIGNIFGAHYLGLSGILCSLDLNHYDRFLGEVVDGERRGDPVIFSAAITEPTAGTDVEDPALLPRARLMMSAERVDGGYVLNGRKCFISNGSIAAYHVVLCALDRKRPLETYCGFLVPTGTPGFAPGRVELKMGQRAAHASELVFTDCFLPRENRIGSENKGMALTEVILAASRAPVAAIATGIARGAYEKALAYARRRRKSGRALIESQWVQLALADMLGKIRTARGVYMAAAQCADAAILNALMGNEAVVQPMMRASSPLLRNRLGRRLTGSDACKALSTAYVERTVINVQSERALGLSSLAKFRCSDLAMEVCLQAIDLLGNEGAEERHQVEKYLRDVKLTQIYEGTNQLNRHAVYKKLIAGVAA